MAEQWPRQDGPVDLFPISDYDILGIGLAICGLIVAAGGGIGGGGFLVPIYILILGFSPKNAIPLSNVTVFGGAVASTFFNVFKRHPLANRPLIDWDIIILMEPLTVAGAIIGANINKILPDLVIIVLLDVLLVWTAHKTLRDALKLYGLEHREKIEFTPLSQGKHGLNHDCDSMETSQLLTQRSSLPEIGSPKHVMLQREMSQHLVEHYGQSSLREVSEDGIASSVRIVRDDDQNPLLSKILDEEIRTPLWNVVVINIMFLVILGINVLNATGTLSIPFFDVPVPYWATQLFIIGCTIVVTAIARRRVLQRTKLKEQAKYEYLTCDMRWDERTTISFPMLSALAGLVAGLFGLGGGIVKGPLMLALGVHPAVTSSTAACMILFTSFTAASTFAVLGLLIPEYAALLVVIGFLATVLGQLIMNYLLSKYKRHSLICFCIGTVVALSAAAMTLESLIKLFHVDPNSPNIWFGS